jgi:AcrR family transcriptional regulator
LALAVTDPPIEGESHAERVDKRYGRDSFQIWGTTVISRSEAARLYAVLTLGRNVSDVYILGFVI